MTMIANIKKYWHVFLLMSWTDFMKLVIGQFYCLSNTTEHPKINWVVYSLHCLSRCGYAGCEYNDKEHITLSIHTQCNKPSLIRCFRAIGSYSEK